MAEEEDKAETKPDEPTNEFSQASDRLRETSKWLLASFGALGAALIGSLQLSTLGDAEGWGKGLALLGFALGLGGALAAIFNVSQVLSSGSLTSVDETFPEAVRKVIDRSRKDLLGGFASLSELETLFGEARAERITNYLKMLEIHDEGVPAYQQAWLQYQVARRELLLGRPVLKQLGQFAEFHELQKKFKNAVTAVMWCAAVAGVGVALFASSLAATDEGTSGEEGKSAAVATIGQLDLSADGQSLLADALGDDCDLDRIPVAALDANDASTEVVVLPNTGCIPLHTTVPTELGLVTRMPADLPDLPD